MLPPLVSYAVNVTLSPSQIETDGKAEMVTEVATLLATVIITVFEVAGDPAAQTSLLIIEQETSSASVKVDVVKVLLVSPVTFDPLTIH